MDSKRNGLTPLDPSTRAVDLVQREISALKELYEVRFGSMATAIEIAHADLVRVPTETQKAVAGLKEVIEETFQTVDQKFVSVEKQFLERDVRADKIADLSQKALDAALLTAEKAVGKQSEAFSAATAKSEAAATKQIDAIGVQLTSAEKTSNEKHLANVAQIARLDNLLAARDARGGGMKELWGLLIGGVVAGAMLSGGIIGVISFLSSHH